MSFQAWIRARMSALRARGAGQHAQHLGGAVQGLDLGLTVAFIYSAELRKLADEADDQRDTAEAWEDEEPAEVAPQTRSVVSVRYGSGRRAVMIDA